MTMNRRIIKAVLMNDTHDSSELIDGWMLMALDSLGSVKVARKSLPVSCLVAANFYIQSDLDDSQWWTSLDGEPSRVISICWESSTSFHAPGLWSSEPQLTPSIWKIQFGTQEQEDLKRSWRLIESMYKEPFSNPISYIYEFAGSRNCDLFTSITNEVT